MTHTGWRKPTPGLGVATQLAQAGEQLDIPKTRAFVAAKRVGAHIGLKSGDMMLLDTLGAFTRAQDWEEGRRPIVWASNAYLMEQTGFSLSALKRHARRLVDIGVISFKDSPNGKRWGHRDEDGVIIEAYGFDLSPLSARAEEFEHLLDELQAERELCQRLKRQITVARRMIRARIEVALSGALSGPWAQFEGVFESLLDRLPRRTAASAALKHLLTRFSELQEKVEAAFLKATRAVESVDNWAADCDQVRKKTPKMNPKGAINEPHILITKQLNPLEGNCLEKSNAAGTSPKDDRHAKPDVDAKSWSTIQLNRHRTTLEIETIMQACPEFAEFARGLGGYIKDWNELHRIAGQIRPMIGMSEHAWNIAQDQLGPQGATAALALIFDKYSEGEVSSPGGYMRGLVLKADAGELHLERSIYGRLRNAQAA